MYLKPHVSETRSWDPVHLHHNQVQSFPSYVVVRQEVWMGPSLHGWAFGDKSISHRRNEPIASKFEMGRGGGGGLHRHILLFAFLFYIAVVSQGDAAGASKR